VSRPIFISHAHEDTKLANEICRRLEARGIPCWIAPRDILPGEKWGAAIIGAINECRAFVLVYSGRVNRSSHVPRELERAASRGVRIVPIRIEDTAPSKDIEYYLSSSHWLDADKPPTEEQLDYLVRTVEAYLAGGEETGPAPGRSSHPLRRVARRAGWAIGIGLSALAVLAGLYWARGREALPETGAENRLSGAPGMLSIRSRPASAHAYLDGRSLGVTPVDDWAVPAGRAQLRIEKEGWASLDTTIDAKEGEKLVLTLSLREAEAAGFPPDRETAAGFGTLSVTSIPSDAEVWIGDRRLGTTPLRNFQLPVGDHRVIVRADGCEDFTKSVGIERQRNTSFQAGLVPLTGSLRVTSEPAGAEVWMQGRMIGPTPAVVQGLAPGDLDVSLRMDGYADRVVTASVEARVEKPVHAALEKAAVVLRVRVLPSGSIYLDGEKKSEDTDAFFETRLAAGAHTLRAVHPTFGQWTKTIDVRPGPAAEILFDFTPKYAVTVVSEPRNAEIWVDGVFTGKYTPAQVQLRPGERKIHVQKEGYRPSEAVELTLEANRPEPIRLRLEIR
jgi:hypothetical protein